MRALVTGAGGFLGGAIARRLRRHDVDVVSFARGNYPHLNEIGVRQIQGNLADLSALQPALEGCDIVYHVAAKAGTWGSYDSYYQPNVVGTQNTIEACRRMGVPHLVYTSSPSVVFDGKDMEGADESAPYPAEYDAPYPRTKALAEQAVMQANDETLKTVSLRPHFIWGPGDTNIVPRVVARAKAGQLRRFRGVNKLVDFTYIDDAVEAHLLAAMALCDPNSCDRVAGKAYFISSGEPLPAFDMIDHFLVAAGLSPLQKTIPPKLAYAAGAVFETVHRLFGLEQEPRMTRWIARELATAHWFDIGAAKRDFGFQPSVALADGLSALKESLQGV